MEYIILSIITVGYIQFFRIVVCFGHDIEEKGRVISSIKKPGTKIKKRRSVLLTTNWYQKALKYQRMLYSGIVKSKAELARKED